MTNTAAEVCTGRDPDKKLKIFTRSRIQRTLESCSSKVITTD